MPSAQDIRRRIKSVTNIQQITKAMKMVAAARLRRAQEKAISSQPYTQKIREVLASVSGGASAAEQPLLEVREVKHTGYLVLNSDKGLAGAYSSNLMKAVVAHIRDKDATSLMTVGRKAKEYFSRRGYRITDEYSGFSEKPTFSHAQTLAKLAAEKFIAGELDEVYLAFTQFHSPINHQPMVIKLLPIDSTLVAGEEHKKCEYIFEPSAAEVLDLLIPRYMEIVIYGSLLQSAASELGARMTAMGSATDNAEELLEKLTLNYNKVRQAAITREITEIVGGAEALK